MKKDEREEDQETDHGGEDKARGFLNETTSDRSLLAVVEDVIAGVNLADLSESFIFGRRIRNAWSAPNARVSRDKSNTIGECCCCSVLGFSTKTMRSKGWKEDSLMDDQTFIFSHPFKMISRGLMI